MHLRTFLRAPEEAAGGGSGGGGAAAPVAAPAAAAAPATLLEGVSSPAAPAAAPVAPGTAYVGADGSFLPGWLDQLPPDLKGNPALTTLGNIHDLAKSYVHTKSLVGSKLTPPAADAPPEKLAEWRKTLGVPDSPEGYGALRPDDFPAEQWDATAEKELTTLAHKHNIHPAAVKEIAALHANLTKAGLESYAAQEAQHLESQRGILQQAWGTKFEEHAGAALRFADTLGLKADNPIFRDAEVVQAMHRAATLYGGEKLITGTSPGLGGDLQGRIHSITDPTSNELIARQYRGEMGPDAQAQAQKILHDLYDAKGRVK